MSVPTVLFVFNRPSETSRVISAIREQTVLPQRLIVFADGPRNPPDEPNVTAVRRIVRSIDWMDTEIIERERNLGLAHNFPQGLNHVFAVHERAIILEDDTLPAPSFYASMCALLDHYASEKLVFSVGGFPSIKQGALPDYQLDVILSPRFSCWGWGTWSDRWNSLSSSISDFKNPFGSADAVPDDAGADLPGMARKMAASPDLSWAVPVALLCLHRGFLHALTRYYLISNIGIASGTHSNPRASRRLENYTKKHNRVCDRVPQFFPEVTIQPEVCQAVQEYVREVHATAGASGWLLPLLRTLSQRFYP